MIWINIICLVLYFILSLCLFFFLYYLKILPNKTEIRFSYNPIDFILDLLKILSYDFLPMIFSVKGIASPEEV